MVVLPQQCVRVCMTQQQLIQLCPLPPLQSIRGACRDLDTLGWLANELASEQQVLHSTIAKLSSRLNTQLASTTTGSSSSGSTADMQSSTSIATATPDTLARLVTELCNAGSGLRQGITDAADALSAARSSLQQLAAAHNPHASGVGQLRQLVGEKQQQLQENQAGLEELTQQVRCRVRDCRLSHMNLVLVCSFYRRL
jgi:hypothetical protein